MAWYRAGSVAVTNGSAVVTGTGTNFVSNTQQGEAFLGPDGRIYEVYQVISATQLTLAANYQGASAGGQGYALMPTSSFARDLALGAAQLLNTFAAVRDGVGAGLFPDGSSAAPAMRFAADQDTGIRRSGDNAISLVTGGADRVSVVGNRVGINNSSPGSNLDVYSAAGVIYTMRLINPSTANNEYNVVTMAISSVGTAVGYIGVGGSGVSNSAFAGNFVVGSQTASPLAFTTGDTERARIDPSGNLLVGVTQGTYHEIGKLVGEGAPIIAITNAAFGFKSAMFYSCGNTSLGSSASCALAVGKPSSGRSINAGGTINASGADYAEYMRKADTCGTIEKGDVCGVDSDGLLTRTWSAAVSYVVKSTDPSLVGGDVWTSDLRPRPEHDEPEPIAPGEPPAMPEADDADALTAWRAAVSAHSVLVAAYPASHGRWASDRAAYEAALAEWEADLETARQCVDRIAFCGQVPVNVAGDFAVGDYIIAAANGAGIQALAIAEADITFDQYRRRIGKVWAVRDGRAWVDVQHG